MTFHWYCLLYCCNVNATQYQSSSYAYSSMSLYSTKWCMDHTPMHLPTDSLLAGCVTQIVVYTPPAFLHADQWQYQQGPCTHQHTLVLM